MHPVPDATRRWYPFSAPLTLVALASLLAGACSGPPSGGPRPAVPEVILATTTSTQDSGLLDVLVPMFESSTGYMVKTIAVGTGQALALGQRGEADVLLVHAPEAEQKWMEAGHGTERRLVMHNDFLLLGPASDPAAVRGMKTASQAFQAIASRRSLFISRGDNSGTHQLELVLWRKAGVEPKGQPWYQEAGQGMGATLNIASEKDAYTLSDRATYLARRATIALEPLVQGDPDLMNIYHVITVDPKKTPRINAQGARAFADFMVSKVAQDAIARFGVDKYGEPLFYADALP